LTVAYFILTTLIVALTTLIVLTALIVADSALTALVIIHAATLRGDVLETIPYNEFQTLAFVIKDSIANIEPSMLSYFLLHP